MRLRSFDGLMLGLALAACGGEPAATEGDSSTGEAPAELAFDEFHAAAEAAYCEWQVACHQYATLERCQAVHDLELRASIRRIAGVGANEAPLADYVRESIAVGRIDYDPQAAARCLEYVRTRSCEHPIFDTPDEAELLGQQACLAVFTGRMGRNGPCMTARECAESALCGFDPGDTEMCAPGACRFLPTPARLGEACTAGVGCEPGSYCASDPDTGAATVCTALLGPGQPCAFGQCTLDAYCDDSGDAPTCRVLQPPGSPCNSTPECARPATCAFGPDDAPPNGRCLRPAAGGEACDPELGEMQCVRADHRCDEATRTCALRPGPGEACQSDECLGDLFCARTQGRCAAVADEGERCGWDPSVGAEIPCPGDRTCDFTQPTSICVAPIGEALCPVPADPVSGE